jgi:lysozyme family protein
MTEEQILDEIIRREGSVYTNRASDRGGPTRWGITLTTLREERGAHMTAVDVAKLTEVEARDIYRRRYIRRPGLDMVTDERLRAFLIDFGVNSGPRRAVIALQNAIGAKPDGVFGAETLKRLEDPGLDIDALYSAVLRTRLKFYVEIVLSDPTVKRFRAAHGNTQLENLRGWMNRLAEFF